MAVDLSAPAPYHPRKTRSETPNGAGGGGVRLVALDDAGVSVEHWQEMFDRVDRRAPINDFDGVPRTFDELLKTLPADAAAKVASAQAERHRATMDAMDRLERDIAASGIDVLVIIGDDQREFQGYDSPGDRHLLRRHHPQRRRAGLSRRPTGTWKTSASGWREARPALPCHPALAKNLIEGLVARNFDITAMKSLVGAQFEGHAYSFIHRRFMTKGAIPIVPVILNTYYPPNQPSPRRCFELGAAIRELIKAYPENIRVGILASGGLSHFRSTRSSMRRHQGPEQKDYPALQIAAAQQACRGSSEIRNWIATAGAVAHLNLDWIAYVPGYRSQALTG